MKSFSIKKVNEEIQEYLIDKVDNLTKPKGALGLLEDIAIQIGMIQKTLSPVLNKPHHIVFAGDHGIADEGVSFSPQEVTRQMVVNFQQGGAGVNFLARQHNIALKIVDTGVNHDFPKECQPLIDMKIRKGTRNYLYEAAMTSDEAECAMANGAECTQQCYNEGCNIISFGEMGITNTSSSAIWMSYLAGVSLDKCIGAGSDHTGAIVDHKYNVLNRAMNNYQGDGTPYDIMCYFGGYEMVATVGAMLKAAELGMVIVIDGFIMTACTLMASKINPHFIDYCIFGHQGDESGHKIMLEHLKAKPILHLGLRLGEGTGALCSYPIIDSAVRMINEMNSFKKIKVTKYF